MLKVALVEDDKPTSTQLRGWIEKVRPDARVFQWFTREDAVRAVTDNLYDVIVLDIELKPERNGGIAVLHAAKRGDVVDTPVLVVSGMPGDVYRGVTKAISAWDYLQKPVAEHVFSETFLDMLRQHGERSVKGRRLLIDPLKRVLSWDDKPLNMSIGDTRLLYAIYERSTDKDPTVKYAELYDVVKSGRNIENVRKHISDIKKAFREVDDNFTCIETVPMLGYRWVERDAGRG
jgi:DNA-binding response OmpR family regulator